MVKLLDLLSIIDYQEAWFFLFMILELFCMMVLLECDRLAMSLRLSLASFVLKLKLLVLTYLIIHAVFFPRCLNVFRDEFSLIFYYLCLRLFARICILCTLLFVCACTEINKCLCLCSCCIHYVGISSHVSLCFFGHACNFVCLCSGCVSHVAISSPFSLCVF